MSMLVFLWSGFLAFTCHLVPRALFPGFGGGAGKGPGIGLSNGNFLSLNLNLFK